MEITLKNVDKVNGLLTVKIVESDYKENVDKELKKLSKTVNIHGFRPGKVPVGIVAKMYGEEVKAQEVNKLLSEKMSSYIRENKINMLGEPLPNKDQAPVDLKNDKEFEFKFDIAIAPEFKAEFTGRDKIPYYEIDVTDKMVDDQIKAYTQRGGSYDKAQTYKLGDVVYGNLVELDEKGNPKDGGLQIEKASLMPQFFKDAEQKKIFTRHKVDDVVVLNPYKAYEGNEVELSSLLKVKKEEVVNYKNDFSFQINEISRFTPAKIDQALFDSVLGKGAVKDENEFRARLKENMQKQYEADSDYKFMLDVRAHMEKKIGKLEYPDALLKRIMLNNNKDKDQKFVDDNYSKSIDELTWHLIKEQLVEANKIKISDDDVKKAARDAVRFQFIQYGITQIPDDAVEKYAAEMLKNQNQVDSLINRSIDQKLTETLKKTVKLDKKTVSLDDFNKMFK